MYSFFVNPRYDRCSSMCKTHVSSLTLFIIVDIIEICNTLSSIFRSKKRKLFLRGLCSLYLYISE